MRAIFNLEHLVLMSVIDMQEKHKVSGELDLNLDPQLGYFNVEMSQHNLVRCIERMSQKIETIIGDGCESLIITMNQSNAEDIFEKLQILGRSDNANK